MVFFQECFYILSIAKFPIAIRHLSHIAVIVIFAKHYVSIITAVASKISDLRGVLNLSNIVLIPYNSLFERQEFASYTKN